jgi:putative molybdopterin biosynthesis protein
MEKKEVNTKFLTTKEASKLLNVNEKKVYSLAQEGRIPGTKVTGKWLFPKSELESFLRNNARRTVRRFLSELAVNRNIILVAGSDDPVMHMVHGLFHKMFPDFTLFSSSVGSEEGLKLLNKRLCHIALSHLFDDRTADFNFPHINALFDDPEGTAVINLFYRNVGFVSRDEEVISFNQIVTNGLRFVNRQSGSGIRGRIDQIINEEKIPGLHIRGYGVEVYTHYDVVSRIMSGDSDTGIATQSAALYAGLHFHRLFEERFDMVTLKDNFFEKGVQAFIEFVRSEEFLKHIKSMAGYDCRSTGKVMYSAGDMDKQ